MFRSCDLEAWSVCLCMVGLLKGIDQLAKTLNKDVFEGSVLMYPDGRLKS